MVLASDEAMSQRAEPGAIGPSTVDMPELAILWARRTRRTVRGEMEQ